MVTLEHLHYSYPRGSAVLKGLNIVLKAGEIFGIIGPNGSGKSTLLKMLAGLLAPTSGEVILGETALQELSARDRARQIAYVPQEYEFLFPFEVIEVVLMGRAPYQSPFGFDADEDLAIAQSALSEMKVAPLAHRNIQDLSGGEKQRVLLARALAQQTPCLILDEPTSQLDLGHSQFFVESLRRKVHDGKSIIVWASHDISLVASVADRVLVLSAGSIYRCGPPAEVVDEKMIGAVYGASLKVICDQRTGRPYVAPI